MDIETAAAVVAATPSYEMRSSGFCCSTCGAFAGGVGGDREKHTEWHAALAALLLKAEVTRSGHVW